MAEIAPEYLDALVRRWQSGDGSVFEELIASTESELRAFAMSRPRLVADADEGVQTAYVVAFERLAEYEPRGTFLAWLKGIVKNRIRELRREHERGRHDALDQALDQTWDDTAAGLGEEGLAHRLSALQPCMQALDERARTILERHHQDGMGLNELAQRYRRPRAVIAKFLFSVRARLRDCIEGRLAGGAHA